MNVANEKTLVRGTASAPCPSLCLPWLCSGTPHLRCAERQCEGKRIPTSTSPSGTRVRTRTHSRRHAPTHTYSPWRCFFLFVIFPAVHFLSFPPAPPFSPTPPFPLPPSPAPSAMVERILISDPIACSLARNMAAHCNHKDQGGVLFVWAQC